MIVQHFLLQRQSIKTSAYLMAEKQPVEKFQHKTLSYRILNFLCEIQAVYGLLSICNKCVFFI